MNARARLLPLALLFLPACGVWIHRSEEPPPSELVQNPRPPRSPRQTRRRTAESAGASASAPASATAPASASESASAAESVAALELALAGPAPTIVPVDKPSPVLVLALDGSARGETFGLSPDGPAQAFTLEEGGHARLPLALAKDTCVTIVAQGGIGVVELDLFVVMGEDKPPRIIAQDRWSGPAAVIGGKPGCLPVDRDVAATLVAIARKGSGNVLVERFRR